MRLQSAALAASLVLALAACGDDGGTKPTTPVTLRFQPIVFTDIEGVANDTVKGIVIVDGTDTLDFPYDSLTNFPRGEHQFRARLNIDYFENDFTYRVDPDGNVERMEIPASETCRVYQASNGTPIDAAVCTPRNRPPRNVLYWSQRNRIYCPAGDFMEFCTPNPSGDGLGLTWPTNSDASAANEYVSQAKLLIAATVASEVGGVDAGRKIAMALYRVGDYSPRQRLQVVPNDSSRYSNVAWTDVRHVPVYNFRQGQLAPTDRRSSLFGLEVKATYLLPQQYQDVLIVRYDVTNISNHAEYRRVHPQIPATGFTVRDVYLTPVVDADIGGALLGEADDDAATIFPAEGLAVAYDREWAVDFWRTPWNAAPGLVGLKILDTDAGTAKGLVFASDTLDYLTIGRENEAYATITAGRGAALTGCVNYPTAFICGGELGQDVRVGYSVGPIATLAPGQTRTLTVALLLAAPTTGQFTSGSAMPPRNATVEDLNSTAKPIYLAAGQLRALAETIAAVRVTPAP